MTIKVLPEIGTTIIAKFIPHVTGTDIDFGCTGQAIVVTRAEERRYTYDNLADQEVGASKNMPAVYGTFKREGRPDVALYVTDWEVAESDNLPNPPDMIVIEVAVAPTVVPAVEPAVEPVVTAEEMLRAKIVSLETQLTRLTADKNLDRSTAIRAFKHLSDRLMSERNERGWCDIFDRIIEEVNGDNPDWLQLEVPEKEWELVSRVVIAVDITTTVTATTLANAIEIANDENYNSQIADQARYGDYEIEEMNWDAS